MEPEMAAAAAGAAAAAAAPASPQQQQQQQQLLLLLPGGREGAGDTMNRRKRATGALLDEMPTPGEYRAAVASAEVYRPGGSGGEGTGAGSKKRKASGEEEEDGGGEEPLPPSLFFFFLPATLTDASDALAVHTALHLAGRRAAVRKGGGERAGCVLLAGPKEGEEEGGEEVSPSTGDALADGEAALKAARERDAAASSSGSHHPPPLPRGWEVVVPVSTARASLTPADLAAAAALAPIADGNAASGSNNNNAGELEEGTPFVVLALVDRDGTCGFSRLYAGIRAPDGAPDRGAEDEEVEVGGGGAERGGGGGSGGGRGGGRGRGGRGGNSSRGGRRGGGRGRGRGR